MVVSIYDKDLLGSKAQGTYEGIKKVLDKNIREKPVSRTVTTAAPAVTAAAPAAAPAVTAAPKRIGASSLQAGNISAGRRTAAVPTYTAAALPAYKAQTEAVNAVYDAALQTQLTRLKSAYDENVSALEAARDALPAQYQLSRSALGARSELQKHQWGEYAAASGLASGVGGQAELSRQNALLGDLAALDRAEAQALSEASGKLGQLKVSYQNDVSAAISQGAFERASALLKEYQAEAQSALTAAKAQADEDYRAYASRLNANAAAYDRSQDALDRAWKKSQQAFQARQDADRTAADLQKAILSARLSGHITDAEMAALQKKYLG